MGMTIRHVVLVSAVLSMGSFVYVVGFAPMDEEVYQRAGAMNQTPTQARLINSIRQAMAQGQSRTADRMADLLIEHHPLDPGAIFWRAMVDIDLGEERASLGNWWMLDDELAGSNEWEGRYTDAQLDYYRAWAKLGIGELEPSQALFGKIADELEAGAINSDGIVMNAGVLYNLACYRAMGGEIELAIGHWERAIELGFTQDNGWWTADPDLKGLHEDVRFWDAGARMNPDRNTRGG